MWRATVLTIFPEMFPGPMSLSLAGKALVSNIWSLDTHDIRNAAIDKHRLPKDAYAWYLDLRRYPQGQSPVSYGLKAFPGFPFPFLKGIHGLAGKPWIIFQYLEQDNPARPPPGQDEGCLDGPLGVRRPVSAHQQGACLRMGRWSSHGVVSRHNFKG